jgi:hypothetical protein
MPRWNLWLIEPGLPGIVEAVDWSVEGCWALRRISGFMCVMFLRSTAQTSRRPSPAVAKSPAIHACPWSAGVEQAVNALCCYEPPAVCLRDVVRLRPCPQSWTRPLQDPPAAASAHEAPLALGLGLGIGRIACVVPTRRFASG